MKKPAKKPAKKRKALKEGKYSHKFLTRLEPAEGERLEKLKVELNCKTFNGLIKRLVMLYPSMLKEADQQQKQLMQLRSDYVQLETAVHNFHFFSEQLAKFKKKGGK